MSKFLLVSIFLILFVYSFQETQNKEQTSCEIVNITINNYDLLNSEKPWIIKIFAPWCGHCKNFEEPLKNR